MDYRTCQGRRRVRSAPSGVAVMGASHAIRSGPFMDYAPPSPILRTHEEDTAVLDGLPAGHLIVVVRTDSPKQLPTTGLIQGDSSDQEHHDRPIGCVFRIRETGHGAIDEAGGGK